LSCRTTERKDEEVEEEGVEEEEGVKEKEGVKD